MKDIKGFEGKYAATIDGRIWSYPKKNSGGHGSQHDGKFLSAALFGRGYLRVQLGRIRGGTVHRFVAETFIPNPKKHPTVNHKNGIKTDNRISNLEWVSYSENNLHAYRHGLHKPRGK